MELNKKKRILITIDWFLPGYKAGGPIQSCANLIAHLKEEYDFLVVTRNTDYRSDEAYPDIPANTWHQLEEGVQVFYFSENHLSYITLKQVINKTPVDIIYINGIFSKFFSLMPLWIAKRQGNIPVVVASRGMFAPGAVNVKSGKKKVFFLTAKWLGLYKNITFHATNTAEQAHIHSVLGEKVNVAVAPNLPKALYHNIVSKPASKEKGVLKLVSIARISPEKNTLYALEVLKSHTYTGKVFFDIYGPINDQAYWQECQHVIKDLPSNIKITYKGSLPSSLVPETLQKYHALFLPTRGENFGHIILESFSAGLPVLVSDQTPWRNLEQLQVGYDLALFEQHQFAAAIQDLIHLDQAKLKIMSECALQYALRFTQDNSLIAANKALFA